MEHNKKHLLTPIIIAMVFSLATVLLYVFGSYSFPEVNRVELYCFLLFANAGMFFGFWFGTKTKDLPKAENAIRIPMETVLKVLFWICLVVSIPKFALYTGNYTLDLGKVIENVGKFFTSAQDIYVDRQNLSSAGGLWRYINYGVVLAGPFYWAYTPLAMMYWRKLSLPRKIGTLFIWLMYLLQYVCTGTNVGFFDFFITLGVVFVLKQILVLDENKPKPAKMDRKQIIRLVVVVVLILILLAIIFGTIMGDRIGNAYRGPLKIGPYTCAYNPDSLLNVLLPEGLRPLAANLTRYLAHAYAALEMAFDLPFDSTFGLGHSWFILDNLEMFSDSMWARTYNMKLDEMFGYGYYGNWHTAYLWFANDVSFLGVPLLLLALFAFFGKGWKDFAVRKDMVGFLIFMLFVKLVYFISANNQVFMNSDTLMAFWLLVLLSVFANRYTLEEVKNEI